MDACYLKGLLDGRSPHGERGLKFCQLRRDGGGKVSLPAWGAWIEMLGNTPIINVRTSLPAWGAWIEIVREELP